MFRPSLTWLASHTKRIEFGPLVTPASFRHPVFTARIGVQLDDPDGLEALATAVVAKL